VTKHGNTCPVLTAHNRTDNLISSIRPSLDPARIALPESDEIIHEGMASKGDEALIPEVGLVSQEEKKRIKEKVSVTFKNSTRGPIVTWFGRWHCASREDLQAFCWTKSRDLDLGIWFVGFSGNL